jgi:transcriptional regulator with XRE-family HTH domain
MLKLAQKQEKIARRISGILEEREWTQQVLADKAGMKKSYLSAILSGEVNLTLGTITRLEEALKAPLVTVL